MCGIVGVVGDTKSVDLASAVSSLRDRGPDAEGEYLGPDVAIGHTRLAIVDLDPRSNQPFVSADGRWVLSYNGEVYNYPELRAELQTLGCEFTTAGDTEVVLKALLAWGTDAFNKFNGMWALALYDTEERSLLLCRDRFGVKPLFYRSFSGGLAFGSTGRAIALATREPLTPSIVATTDFLLTSSCSWPGQTWFEGMHELPAGHFLRWNSGQTSVGCFYRLQGAEGADPGDLGELFMDAVKIRLRSDVPIGVCLSGGVDSSLILAAVSQLGGEVTAYTVRSDGLPDSEHVRAHEFAGLLGVPTVTVDVPSAEFDLNSFADLTSQLEGPSASPAIIPFASLMAAIKSDGHSVALDGQGADEAFMGYLERTVPYEIGYNLSNWEFAQAIDSARALAGYMPLGSAAAYTLRCWVPGAASAYQSKRGIGISLGPKSDAASSPLNRRPGRVSGGAAASRYLVTQSLPSLLRYSDRLSMLHAVEGRQPFMDYRLVEFGVGADPALHTANGQSKSLLRQLGVQMVPGAKSFGRPKLGFPTPVSAWMRTPVVKRYVLDSKAADCGVLDRRGVMSLFERQEKSNSAVLALSLFRLCGVAAFWNEYG